MLTHHSVTVQQRWQSLPFLRALAHLYHIYVVVIYVVVIYVLCCTVQLVGAVCLSC